MRQYLQHNKQSYTNLINGRKANYCNKSFYSLTLRAGV